MNLLGEEESDKVTYLFDIILRINKFYYDNLFSLIKHTPNKYNNLTFVFTIYILYNNFILIFYTKIVTSQKYEEKFFMNLSLRPNVWLFGMQC